MARGKTLSVVFKNNLQHQAMLFPQDVGDLIPKNHPVRVVNEVLEKVDITELLRAYKPGGTSSYHPRMLLKVLVYAYINNVYSSRKIEEAVGQNIHYMWLSGMSKPDHNTINRFRSQRLQKTLQPIFTQVVLLLCEEGLLSVKDLYTDGTIIEANANRYTFVWGNSIKNNKEKIKQQLNELWKYARQVAASELDDTEPTDFDQIDADKVSRTIETINTALKGKQTDRKVKQQLAYAKSHWPSALKKYEEQEKIIGSHRNSYSKTDPDATFMRMKDDHMKTGPLKPAYNLQLSTNNQYIACYSIHQNPADTSALISHMEQHMESFKETPADITADAGYGSEQNYKWLEDKGINAYVKHNYFDRDQNSKLRNKKPFGADNLQYDESKDEFRCPGGEPMKNIESYITTTKAGYEQTHVRYKADNCERCPLHKECPEQNGNLVVSVNHNLNRLRQRADDRLKSLTGIQKRKQRCFDTEPVFGNIKHNHQFRRFMLRGTEKVSIEIGLLALAHNLRKKTA